MLEFTRNDVMHMFSVRPRFGPVPEAPTRVQLLTFQPRASLCPVALPPLGCGRAVRQGDPGALAAFELRLLGKDAHLEHVLRLPKGREAVVDFMRPDTDASVLAVRPSPLGRVFVAPDKASGMSGATNRLPNHLSAL